MKNTADGVTRHDTNRLLPILVKTQEEIDPASIA